MSLHQKALDCSGQACWLWVDSLTRLNIGVLRSLPIILTVPGNALFVPAPHLSIYDGIICSCTDFSQRNPVFLQAPQYYIPHPFSPIRHLTEILKLESLLPLSPFSFMVRQA